MVKAKLSDKMIKILKDMVGKTIVKIIIVPRKIINIVLK